MASARALARNWALALLTPIPLAGLFQLPRYLSDWHRFKAMPGAPKLKWRESYPCLADATRTTRLDAHYFYQGAWLARQLVAAKPDRHVDIASSILAIGVLSAHVPTVFVDIRPPDVDLPNLDRVVGSITSLPFADASIPSLSCLHVIEHIGLGRYGDSLDPTGAERAAKELQRVLNPAGRLYLSTPVGRERICFNAHRVFSPATIVRMFNDLQLERFAFVDDAGALHASAKPDDARALNYGCGLFRFKKEA